MTRRTGRRTRRPVVARAGAVGLALAGALALAACSSSSGSGGSDTPAAAGGSGGTSGGAVEVDAHMGALGTYLTDAKGNTLYLFVADSAGTSTCTGSCASAWPPLTATGDVTAGSGVDSSMLTTITRDDGGKQVAYDGHPLYYFVKDAKTGDTSGQGVDGFGALWWVVAPSGDAITSTAAMSNDPGYGY